jgi:ABC-2 type transport system permease protein
MASDEHLQLPKLAPWRQEWQGIWQDPWLRALVGWLPLVLALWMGSVFQGGLLRELPIGLVDQDHSTLSRHLARELDGSALMSLQQEYLSVAEGVRALRAGNIYALVLFPHDLEKQVRQQRQPVVTAFYNGQLLLVGRLLNGSLLQILGAAAAQLSVANQLVQTPVLWTAMGDSVPILSQVTPLYNQAGNYALFLLPALLLALWQMLILIAAVSALVRRRRLGLRLPGSARLCSAQLVRIFFPYLCIYWGWGILLLGLLVGGFGWPMVGSWGLLILAQGLMVLACLAVGCLFYGLTQDGARAMSLVAVYSAPAFAFMGITFPTHDMNGLAQLWRGLLPVAHYAELHIGQANIGMEGAAALYPLWALLPFGLLWPLVVLLLGRRSDG